MFSLLICSAFIKKGLSLCELLQRHSWNFKNRLMSGNSEKQNNSHKFGQQFNYFLQNIFAHEAFK